MSAGLSPAGSWERQTEMLSVVRKRIGITYRGRVFKKRNYDFNS